MPRAKPEGMGMHGQLIEPWHRRYHAPQHLPDTHICSGRVR